MFLGQGGRIVIEVALEIGPLQQEVVVTAGATEQLQSRTGAPVTVIDEETLEAINKLDVLEALRLVPAAQIVQVGQRGGATSLFLRGGESNFTKVLIDGIPANDIGGGFDFSQLTLASVERIEVLRQTNSVIYGSDALTGVVNISTRRGTSRVPALDYMIDGGNLGTFNNALLFGGAYKGFDYFSQYLVIHDRQRRSEQPLSQQHLRRTFRRGCRQRDQRLRHDSLSRRPRRQPEWFRSVSHCRRLGVRHESDLRQRGGRLADQPALADHSAIRNHQPGIALYEPDSVGDSVRSVWLRRELSGRGCDARRCGRKDGHWSGHPRLRRHVPQLFPSRTARQSLFGQATFQATRDLAISAGGRFEHEAGYSDPDADPTATRNNGGAFVEARATLVNRVYIGAGIGVEHNEIFETAYTPRLSVAAYLRNPSTEQLGETKVTLNIGKGIKAPSVYQGQNSLYALVNGTPAGADVDPLGPEKSRGFDVGLEQAFAASRFRARVGYFNNTFESLLEFLSRTQLVAAGVPPAVAASTSFGAYINSASFDAQGVELSADAALGGGVRFSASYTFLDAEVTEAFGRSAVFNPAFPTIPIGAFSPLVGARPFRRPTNSGLSSSATRPVLSRSRCRVTSRARATTARS